MTAYVTAHASIEHAKMHGWGGVEGRPSLTGDLLVTFAPGDQDRALATLDDLVERVRADIEATR